MGPERKNERRRFGIPREIPRAAAAGPWVVAVAALLLSTLTRAQDVPPSAAAGDWHCPNGTVSATVAGCYGGAPGPGPNIYQQQQMMMVMRERAMAQARANAIAAAHNRAHALNEEANSDFTAGNFAAAVALYQQAQQLWPEDQTIRTNLINAQAALKQSQAMSAISADLNSKLDASGSAANSSLDFQGLNDPNVVDLRGTTRTSPRLLRDPNADAPLTFMTDAPKPKPAAMPPLNLTQIRTRIKGIEDALRRLDASHRLDATDRAEWIKQSNDATKDAYKLGASLTLDLAGHLADDQIKAIDAKIDEGGGDDVVNALEARKTQLEHLKDGIEKSEKVVDIADKTGEEESKSQLEKIYDLCEKGNLLPEGTSEAKDMIDASYAVAQQAVSVERINQLNDNADRYLGAVDALGTRMKSLVRLEKAVIAQQSHP